MFKKMGSAALLIALAHAPAQSPTPSQTHEPALSAAEMAVVSRAIATLKSSTDRHMAAGWSSSKKLSELICRPAALPILQKQTEGVDRVFLGTDAPTSVTLESNQRLTGSGEYRTPRGWTDFTFVCTLNPDTGKVTNFQATPSKPSH